MSRTKTKRIVWTMAVLVLAVVANGCSPQPTNFDRVLTNDYRLRSVTGDDVKIFQVNTYVSTAVPEKVVEIAWDNKFILAKQELGWSSDRIDAQRTNSGMYKFWIVEVSSTNFIGPLSGSEFQTKITQLGATNLHLRPISEYKWPPEEDYLENYYKKVRQQKSK